MTANQVADIIKKGKKIVFLTGAGVSTPSGIPDYRSVTGLYTKSGIKEPEYLLSRRALTNDTEDFHRFIKQLCNSDAKPNIIHKKMAELDKTKNVAIVTQNIDGLHIKAGSKNVVEFHGSLASCYCSKCNVPVDVDIFVKDFKHDCCGGTLRPDVVLYDEQINYENINRAIDALTTADTVVVVGTSFKVYPFAALIEYALSTATIITINKEPVYNVPTDYTYIGDAVDVFGLI